MLSELQNLAPIFRDVCLPIFLLVGMGWAIDRKFTLDLGSLVKLNIYLFVPAFLFVRVIQSSASGSQGGKICLFTCCVIGAMFVASQLIGWLTRESLPQRKAMAMSTMFYNAGNFGIPVTALAFPETGPSVHVWVLMTINLATFSIGMLIARSQGAASAGDDSALKRLAGLLTILKQPSILCIIAALLINQTDFDVESVNFVWKPVSFLADAVISFALVTLGVQLSKTRPPAIKGHLAWALGLRLIGGPIIAAGMTVLFGFSGEVAAVLILGASAPTAINTALLAHEFKAEGGIAAATVFYSTLMSIVTVTIVIAVLKSGL